MEAWREELYHYAKGSTAKDHKYIRKEGNRYIYEEPKNKQVNIKRAASSPLSLEDMARQIKSWEYDKKRHQNDAATAAKSNQIKAEMIGGEGTTKKETVAATLKKPSLESKLNRSYAERDKKDIARHLAKYTVKDEVQGGEANTSKKEQLAAKLSTPQVQVKPVESSNSQLSSTLSSIAQEASAGITQQAIDAIASTGGDPNADFWKNNDGYVAQCCAIFTYAANLDDSVLTALDQMSAEEVAAYNYADYNVAKELLNTLHSLQNNLSGPQLITLYRELANDIVSELKKSEYYNQNSYDFYMSHSDTYTKELYHTAIGGTLIITRR